MQALRYLVALSKVGPGDQTPRRKFNRLWHELEILLGLYDRRMAGTRSLEPLASSNDFGHHYQLLRLGSFVLWHSEE